MKIDYLVGRKCARDLNVVTHIGWSVHDLTSVIHIDQQYFRLYSMSNKPYCLCILILQQKIIVQIEKKTYNFDETRVVNTDRL
jgi:hypothetical protein